MTRKVVNALNECNDTRRFYAGLLAWTGFKACYIELDAQQRQGGKSKYNIRRLLTHAFNGIFSFSIFPLRWATFLGIIFSSLSFFLGAAFGVIKILRPEIPAGFTSIFVLITFVGGVILLSLGIIGDYVGRIFEAANKRPRFVVDRITGKDQL
jgi:hypothetical protein